MRRISTGISTSRRDNMSSDSSALSYTTSMPSRTENLLGAVVWLLPADQIPDHGRYKLKAKACGHPCVVVEDCRTDELDFVRICILTSYSQSFSYNSLGKKEKHDHVPIHPNKPNDRTTPSILHLRPRQRNEMSLRRNSWVNTRRTYMVPISVLRPYENYQSWCRYRLADSSIQALQSALLGGPENPISTPTTFFSAKDADTQEPGTISTFYFDRSLTLDDQVREFVEVPDQKISSFQQAPSFSQFSVSYSESCAPADLKGDEINIVSGTELPRLSDIDRQGRLDAGNDSQFQNLPAYQPSPFHLVYPFDDGPLTTTDDSKMEGLVRMVLCLAQAILVLQSPFGCQSSPSQRSPRTYASKAGLPYGSELILTLSAITTRTLNTTLRAIICEQAHF